MRELPSDVVIEAMEWLDPVRVMQLRCACREWRDEAVRAIRTVALIDDVSSYEEASDQMCTIQHTRIGKYLPPNPGQGSWWGKFPSSTFPRFHLLPNVRRVEVAPVHTAIAGNEGARAVADILATWPRLEEAAIMASPPLQRVSMGWPVRGRMLQFTAPAFVRALDGRCPDLRVLSFCVYYRSHSLAKANVDAFRSGLALLPKLEVLDVMRMGYDLEAIAPLLIPCTEVLSRLRVFVAPRSLPNRDKLFPVLLRNAPALEELHVVCHLPPVNEYDTEDSDEPLIEALLAHGMRMSSEEMGTVVEGLPKLHTCSISLRGLSEGSVARFGSVLQRGVLKRVAIFPCLLSPVQLLERFVAECHAVGVPLLFQFPRWHYTLDLWVESVSVESPPHETIERGESELAHCEAGDLRTFRWRDGFVTVRVASRRVYWREEDKPAPLLLGPLTWPEYDAHRFNVSTLGDPRVAALGLPASAPAPAP